MFNLFEQDSFPKQRVDMRRVFYFSLFLSVVLIGTSPSFAQDAQTPVNQDEINAKRYVNGIGLNISLTNSGFGVGGYLQRPIGTTTSWLAEFYITTLKDEREQRFFGIFGESIIPNKYNYMLMVPFQVGLQKRLFQESIQDNFRPYVQVSAGPTVGWISPYFQDLNDNQRLDGNERTYDVIGAIPKGSFTFAMGGSISVGANFGLSRRVTQGIRFGYTFHYFFDDIELLEPRVKEGQRFFGTPTISLIFGRLHR